MKEEWITKPFLECIENVTYSTKINKKEFLPKGRFPIISQEENFINGYWENESDVYKVEKPVVIFGDHTKILKFIDFNFVLGADGVKILKPREFLIPKFFYYFLYSSKLPDLGYARHFKLLKELIVSIPPLPEQQRIVDILDQSFAAIDQAIENTEKNLINAKELFLYGLYQLFSNYARTSSDRFIGDVSNVIAGQSPEGKYYNNNGTGLPFYQGKKEFTDKFLGKPTTWTTKITKEALENDILMSVRAPVGPVNIATEKICIGRGLSAIRPSKYVLRDYLFYFFISNKEKLVGNSGAVFNSINKTQIEKIQIPVPPINKQHEFVNLVALLSNRVQNLDSVYSKKKNLLIELKQSILHKAFSGDLT